MVGARDRVLDILDRLDGDNPIGQVVVVDDDCVVGILDESDVAVALDRVNGSVPALPTTVEGNGAAADEVAGDNTAADDERESGRRAGARAWVLVGALCLATAAALYRPPYVVIEAGPAVDVADDVSVAGLPVTAVNGRYLATGVEVRRTNAWGVLLAALGQGRQVVRLEGATGAVEAGRHPGLSRETRMLAAAAAASAQGLPVSVVGTGARVVAVRAGSPAAGALRPGDVIVAANGGSVTQAGPLLEFVRQHPVGTGLRLSVDRGGRVQEVVVRSEDAPGAGTIPELGVVVETRDLAVELPFEVRFAGEVAGGPGAGLAYALAIADLLSTRDLAQGRTIAAAGHTLDAAGQVGAVGGIDARADAAAGAGATVFVVPREEVDGARVDGLQVEGVESLARALEALSTAV
jgi:Lon-like protease